MSSDGVFILILTVLTFFIGSIIGASIRKATMEKEAIEAGVAQYDSQTAEFEWIKVEK